MHSIVNITRFFMIASGLWKISFTENLMFREFYKYYSVIVQAIFSILTMSLIVRFMETIISKAPPAKIFGTLTIAIIVSMTIFNILVFLKNGIPFLFSEVIKEEKKALNSPDEEIRRVYLSQVRYYKFVSISQALAVFLSAGMFVASNMFKYLTHSFLEGEGFMYDIWFPFDESTHDGVVILSNIIMVTLGYFLNVASRLTPQTLIIFANAQLQVLQIRIRKVFSNKKDEEKIRLFNVKELVKKHQKLIRFVTSLNNSIKNVIFMEFVLNSVNVAAATLRIITAKNIVEIAFSCLHLTVLLTQMFALAWSTNELNIQSGTIADAVYESNWIDQSEEVKKILYIMLMRAQKPLAVTIGTFRPINIDAALITMKGAYTYGSVIIQKYT